MALSIGLRVQAKESAKQHAHKMGTIQRRDTIARKWIIRFDDGTEAALLTRHILQVGRTPATALTTPIDLHAAARETTRQHEAHVVKTMGGERIETGSMREPLVLQDYRSLRPGAEDWAKHPSLIGDMRVWPDGRRERTA